MKILQVCPLYYPTIGGIEEHVKNISEKLAKSHEVTVLTTDNSGLPEKEEINGVLVRRFRSFAPGNAYHISLSMLKELRRSQFDIVHGHNYHSLPLFFSRYTNRTRFIVTPHYHRYGTTLFRDMLIKLYKPFGKKIFQEADGVIALSEHEKNLLMEDFQIEKSKISVIPNGVNLENFQGLEKREKEYQTILCVARLEEFKGVQYAIQVLPLLGENVCLEVVGKGTYKAKLISLARKLGVAHRIDFYQDLRGKELAARYVNADLFMLLSRFESYPISVLEALAAKTPCLVTKIWALKPWVDNNNCFGIDYPINNDQLAELIKRVIGRKIEGVKLWQWEQVIDETVRVYQDLA
jgi:glycosyltransferase involved in cell wall biosynthesis